MKHHDEQFNLRKRHPLGRLHLLNNEVQSYLARLALKKSLDVSYGDTLGQRIDLFPAAEPEAPVFIFIHGGYFRALDKKQYSYVARPFVQAGCSVALVNYDLAPTVSVREIVDQNIKAFLWIHQNIDRWNGDPQNIVLGGHSVGAFLAAKILEFDWEGEVRKGISGAVLLSGIYDLTKVRQSYLNEALRLSEEDVTHLSPIFGRISDFPQAIVAVGEEETEEFVQQSKDYSEKLRTAGSPHELILLKGKNHYTVARMLSKRKNALMDRVLSLCGG